MEYAHLTRNQKALYNSTIVTTHLRRIELTILTLDGNLVRSMTPRVLSGQITLDVTLTPMQVLTVSLLDASRSVVFEPNSPGDGPIHRQFMVQVNDSRQVPGIGWVDCFVFTGPIWDFERKGPVVTVVAHSIDRLASGTIRKAKMWQRKVKKTSIIRELLAEAGCTDMRIPDLDATTPVHTHVGVIHPHPKQHPKETRKVRHRVGYELTREDTYWDKASSLASSMNRLLYPTGDGTIELRSHPERAVYHFSRALLADVDLKRPGDDGPNTWLVVGAKPKGAKQRVSSGLVGFPNGHPLSAGSLAWHGKPDQILETIHNEHLKTKAECHALAVRHRDRAARMVAEVTFDALPVPWLRPWDLVTAQAGWGVPSVHIRQLTYPLSPDTSPMTVGAVKQAVPIHHHHHHHHGGRR
jgi:hypothetical protein